MQCKRHLTTGLKFFILLLILPHRAAANDSGRPSVSYSGTSPQTDSIALPLESTIIKYTSGLLESDEVERIASFIKPRPKETSDSSLIAVENWKIECISLDSEFDLLAKRCRPIQNTEPATELPLDAILMRALVVSPLLKSKIATSDDKRWLLRQAFSTWYPSLSLSSGSVLRTYVTNRQNYGSPSSSANPSVSGTAFQPTDPISTTSATSSAPAGSALVTPYTSNSSYTQAYPVLTLNWTFYDPTRASSVQAAQKALSSSEFDVRYTAHQIISQVSQSYTQALTGEYAVAAYLRQNESYKRLLSIIERQVVQGYVPINQTLTLKSQQAGVLYRLNNAILNYVQAMDSLKALIGIKPDSNLMLSHDGFMMVDWPYSNTETNEMILSYPQVRSLYEQSDQYQKMASSQFKGYIPKLSVLGYTTYMGTRGSMSFSPPQQPSGAWSQQLSNYIGLNATWNIFDGFSAYQTGMSYRSQSKSIKMQAEDTIMQLRQSVYGALSLFKRRDSLINPLRRSYAFSVAAVESAKKRVKIGLDDPSVIYNADLSSAQVIADFSEAYGNILDAYFTLLDLSGTSVYAKFKPNSVQPRQ